jgi:hypothetical protein
MNPTKPAGIADASKLSIFIKLMTLIFALNLLIDRGAQVFSVYRLGGNFDLYNTFMLSLKLPFFWTGLIVPITYLFALWAAANFLKNFEHSKSFDNDSLKYLQSIGADLMYAAMAAILLVPTIEAWINQGSRSVKTHWDIEAVTIGMIGLILKFVSQRAQNLQNKVDSFV